MNIQIQAHIGFLNFLEEVKDSNSFGVEHVPEKIKELFRNKNIKANIF